MKLGKYAKVVVLSTLAETKSLVDISTVWFHNKGRLYQQANIEEIREAVNNGWLIQESKKSYKANTEKIVNDVLVDLSVSDDSKLSKQYSAWMNEFYGKLGVYT